MTPELRKERRIEDCLAHFGSVNAEQRLIDDIFVEECKLGIDGCSCKYQDTYNHYTGKIHLCMYELLTFSEAYELQLEVKKL